MDGEGRSCSGQHKVSGAGEDRAHSGQHRMGLPVQIAPVQFRQAHFCIMGIS